MHASDAPHRCSAAAMNQASKGGLEKYPDASSRDHDQYWDSSKNRSTAETRNAARRTIVSVETIRAAVQKLRLGDVGEPEGEIINEDWLCAARASISINRLPIDRIQSDDAVAGLQHVGSGRWAERGGRAVRIIEPVRIDECAGTPIEPFRPRATTSPAFAAPPPASRRDRCTVCRRSWS